MKYVPISGLHKQFVTNVKLSVSPFSLLSMGGMAFESHSDEAEPFFQAILSMYPFWTTGWFAVSAYYRAMELFTLADMIEVLAKR